MRNPKHKFKMQYVIFSIVLLAVLLSMPSINSNANQVKMEEEAAHIENERTTMKSTDIAVVVSDEIEDDFQEITGEVVTEVEQDDSSSEPDSVDEDINRGYSDNDVYLWAKIVMCESEGESYLCKMYVAQVIENRINSDEFPDNVYDVIFQKNQFTPTFNGRWERCEPNQDCYDAVYEVIHNDEPLISALYFECCSGSSWHSQSLTKIVEEDGTRFYK